MTPLSSPSVTAIICAAGKGERAKMNGNKLFAPLYGGVSAADKTGTFAETAGRTARTHERAMRTEGKDGSADTTERNFRTEATDDVNGRNEQTGNADERAQTDKPIRTAEQSSSSACASEDLIWSMNFARRGFSA